MCPNRIEVEVFGNEVNASVLRLPSRQQPGVLIQADSLQILLSLIQQIELALAENNTEQATELTGEAREILEEYEGAYRRALL